MEQNNKNNQKSNMYTYITYTLIHTLAYIHTRVVAVIKILFITLLVNIR